MSKKMKLKLNDIKVQSFITTENQKFQGGITGNCLSFIHITCPDPNCDFQSIPLDECDFYPSTEYGNDCRCIY